MRLSNVVLKKFSSKLNPFIGSNDHGLSLLELLVAMGIVMIVISMAARFQQGFAAASLEEDSFNQAKQDVGWALRKLKYDLEIRKKSNNGICEDGGVCAKGILSRPKSSSDPSEVLVEYGTRCRANKKGGLSSENQILLRKKLKEFASVCSEVITCSGNQSTTIYRRLKVSPDNPWKVRYITDRDRPSGICMKEDSEQRRLIVYVYSTFIRRDGSLGFFSKSTMFSKQLLSSVELLP